MQKKKKKEMLFLKDNLVLVKSAVGSWFSEISDKDK